MAPALRSLARTHRVFSFSLGEATGPDLFDEWTSILDRIVDRAAERVALVGVSFGGLVAARYAARRSQRISHLVLVSAPAPGLQLDARASRWVTRPRLSMPLFACRGAVRMIPEVHASLPTLTSRARFAVRHVTQVLRHPASPDHMARCVRAWEAEDLTADVRKITAPSLVVTGEPHLDRVVPVASTLEYLSLIPGARHATLGRTGHLGLVIRPDEFAALVTNFINAADDRRAGRSA
jgi:pimeloyl-ACP methyl ester carboxylesterase